MPLYHAYYAQNDHYVGTPYVDTRPTGTYIIPESGTVYLHFWVDGRDTIRDTVVGQSWTNVGSVPLSGASGSFPKSIGPFANSKYLSCSNNAWGSHVGAHTFAFIVNRPVGTGYVLSCMDTTDGGGQGVYFQSGSGAANNKIEFVNRSGGLLNANVNVTGVNGVVNSTVFLVVGGYNGTDTYYMRANSSSLIINNTATQPLSASVTGTYIGASPHSLTQFFNGNIAEVYLCNVTPTSASLASLYNAISSSLSGAVP